MGGNKKSSKKRRRSKSNKSSKKNGSLGENGSSGQYLDMINNMLKSETKKKKLSPPYTFSAPESSSSAMNYYTFDMFNEGLVLGDKQFENGEDNLNSEEDSENRDNMQDIEKQEDSKEQAEYEEYEEESFIPLSTAPLKKKESYRKSETSPIEASHISILKTYGKLPLPPWAKTHYKSKGVEGLTEELKDFIKYIETPVYEKMVRKEIINRIKLIIESHIPQCKCYTFGSYSTNLCTPSSDIDVVVLGLPPKKKVLHMVSHLFSQYNFCKKPLIISKAKVPIIKLEDSLTKIHVDISFDEEGGIKNTKIIKSLLKKYKWARELIIILKYFISERGLDEPFTGGLGSYALSLMVISFLQNHPSNNMENPSKTNLGQLLIEFFGLYGKSFNYFYTGISVKDGNYYNKMEKGFFDPNNPFLLSVQDPNNEDNDVGRSAYKISVIRQAFKFAYEKLSTEPSGDPYASTMLTRIIRHNPEIEENRRMYKRIYEELVNQKIIESIDKSEDNSTNNYDEPERKKLKKKKKTNKAIVNGKKRKKQGLKNVK